MSAKPIKENKLQRAKRLGKLVVKDDFPSYNNLNKDLKKNNLGKTRLDILQEKYEKKDSFFSKANVRALWGGDDFEPVITGGERWKLVPEFEKFLEKTLVEFKREEKKKNDTARDKILKKLDKAGLVELGKRMKKNPEKTIVQHFKSMEDKRRRDNKKALTDLNKSGAGGGAGSSA